MLQLLILSVTTLYQAIAVWQEDRTAPPGERFDAGGYHLHLYQQGFDSNPATPTIVLDHSLGGVEGYAIVDALAKLGPVCIYDRAGYGWSDQSPKARTSNNIVEELDNLLTQAKIEPPYLLVGDSFGSYNMRLYAHRFPEKVTAMVLTDGLHEGEMLQLPIALKGLKLVFLLGFWVAIVGSSLGIIRLLRRLGVFEILKPELKQIAPDRLQCITRSFCRPKHWITMAREIWSLEQSAREVSEAKDLGNLPIVSIKSSAFFKPTLWTRLIPAKQADRVRDRIHEQLLTLSSRSKQIQASESSHFVWIDQPDVMVEAVKQVRELI
jgi:pimeloyl-ACP methyl ester carboxylesterase